MVRVFAYLSFFSVTIFKYFFYLNVRIYVDCVPRFEHVSLYSRELESVFLRNYSGIFKEGSEEVDTTLPRLSDDELLAQIDSCLRLKPSIIYYNRVPKCGSTTIQAYIDENVKASKNTGRELRHVSYYFHASSRKNPFNHAPGEYLNPKEIAYQVNEMEQKKPAFFDSHTSFASYLPANVLRSKYGNGDMAYISVVREPASRLLSWKVYDCKKLNENCELTFDNFSSRLKNLQLAYLCGHQKECLSRDETSAYIAKVRIVHSFSLVGITERINQTTKLLQRLFPEFFLKVTPKSYHKRKKYMTKHAL